MSEVFEIKGDGFVTCWITIGEDSGEGFCELSLDHDDREWPNTTEMELTREQAAEIAKILTQWATKEADK